MKWVDAVLTAVAVLGGILGTASFAAGQESTVKPTASTLSTRESARAVEQPDFWKMSAAEFAKLPDLDRPIDHDRVQSQLLAAAIFHETNRRRVEQSLTPLMPNARASQAAELQAKVMADLKFLGHENPRDPSLRTLKERLDHVGIRLRVGLENAASENVAQEIVRQYEGGKPVYTREENGKTVFSYQADGPAIGMHTYRAFARLVVDGWMGSPPHRRNLLGSNFTDLGVGLSPARNELDMEVFYCVQVFVTPRRD